MTMDVVYMAFMVLDKVLHGRLDHMESKASWPTGLKKTNCCLNTVGKTASLENIDG